MQEVYGMDPHEMTSRKPRKPRSDRGPRLTERNHKALSWIGQQYAVRLDQLQIVLARLGEPGQYATKPKEKGRLTRKRTMDLVRRWERLGLVNSGRFLHGDPAWVWLSVEGLHAVRQQIGDLRSFEPTPARLSHLWQGRARLRGARAPPRMRRPAWLRRRRLPSRALPGQCTSSRA